MDSAAKLSATRPEAAVFLVAALAAMYAGSQFLRNSIGVIASDPAREMSLSATQTGLLSSAFFLTFATVQVPIGIPIERFGPKPIMLVMAPLVIYALRFPPQRFAGLTSIQMGGANPGTLAATAPGGLGGRHWLAQLGSDRRGARRRHDALCGGGISTRLPSPGKLTALEPVHLWQGY